MIVQILTTSANDYAFEDWGEENLLLAIETKVPYIKDPPVSGSPLISPLTLSFLQHDYALIPLALDWPPKKKKGSEDPSDGDVNPEASLEMPDDESEKENDTTQPGKGTGRGKGKTRAKQVHKRKAVTLALDRQDEEDIELPLEDGLAQRDLPTETQYIQDRTRQRLPAAKEKGKVISKPLDLDDSSDSDTPFSTRESGSSDESEEEEDDDEDRGEEPKDSKGKKVSIATDHCSLQLSRLSPSNSTPHSLHLNMYVNLPSPESRDLLLLRLHPPQSLPQCLHQRPVPLLRLSETMAPLSQNRRRPRVPLPKQRLPRYSFYPLRFQRSDLGYQCRQEDPNVDEVTRFDYLVP